MKSGIFENDIKDEDVFNMLLIGKVRCICPYCNKLNEDFPPNFEQITCQSCNEVFISPLYDESFLTE